MTRRAQAAGARERDWCDVEVLRRLRAGASLAALRKEIEPADRRRLAAFLPSWQGVDRHHRAGAGVDRLREVLVPLQGLALPAEVWERDVLPRRTGAYSQTWLDRLCACGEVIWVGAGPLGRSGRVALYFREDAAAIGPPPGPDGGAPAGRGTSCLRARLAAGPCFFTDLLAEIALPPRQLREALWDLVWAGEATNDAWAPLRARGWRSPATRRRARRAARPRSLRVRRRAAGAAGAHSQVQGRWSLIGSRVRSRRPAESRRASAARALAELLLERYGIVTREQVLAEGIPGGFASLYDDVLGPRDAGDLPPRLLHRGDGRRAVRAAGRRGAPARRSRRRGGQEPERERTLVIAAADPPSPTARRCLARREARSAGRAAWRAHTGARRGRAVPYVERGGRGLSRSRTRRPPGDAGRRCDAGLEALAARRARPGACPSCPRADRRRAGDLLAAGRRADRARASHRVRGA